MTELYIEGNDVTQSYSNSYVRVACNTPRNLSNRFLLLFPKETTTN